MNRATGHAAREAEVWGADHRAAGSVGNVGIAERWRNEEKILFGLYFAAIVTAFAFPYPATKTLLGAVLGAVSAWMCFRGFYLALAVFVLGLPLTSLVADRMELATGINIQTLSLVGFAVLAWFHKEDRSTPRARNPVSWPLLGLIALVTLSAVRSHIVYGEDLVEQLSRVKNWFSYSVLGLLAFHVVRRTREKEVVLAAVFLSVVMNALYGMRDVIRNPSLNLESNRVVSLIAVQPNLFGGFLVLYAFFFLGVLTQQRVTLRKRMLLLAALSVVLVCLVYTLSRGAWLAFLGASAVMATLKNRRLLLPLVLVSAVVYALMPEEASQRWQEGFEGEYDPQHWVREDVTVDEAASRIVQWKTFPSLLGESPIFGFGFGRYGRTIFEKNIDEKPRSAHSTLIELGVENGIPALLLYGWLLWNIYSAASWIYRAAPRGTISRALAFGLMGATVALVLLDLTGTRFRNCNIMAYYWILAGLTLNERARLRPEREG